jgi:hypothetical protein
MEKKNQRDKGWKILYAFIIIITILIAMSFIYQMPVKIICIFDDKESMYVGIQTVWEYLDHDNTVHNVFNLQSPEKHKIVVFSRENCVIYR